MKKMILIILIIIFCQFINSLSALLSDFDKTLILNEVYELIARNSQTEPQVLNVEQLLGRNQVKNSIQKAIKDNNTGLAIDYFIFYSTILDTLVFSQPLVAKEITYGLRDIYQTIPAISERLYYYSGLTDFYMGFYDKAEAEILLFMAKHPNAELSSDLFTLLIKNYLNSGKELLALEQIERRSIPLTDEQNFLTGHICFSLQKDDLAVYYFNQVTSQEYKNNAAKMLSFLSSLKADPGVAKTNYEAQLQSDPSNPFILLSLARLSSITGDWQEAELYYSRYISAAKSYREFQGFYELATTYLNMGNQNKALEILDNAIQKPDLSEYVSSLLHLWAEIKANKGEINQAHTQSVQVIGSLDANTGILVEKINLLNRISTLKSQLSAQLDIEAVNQALAEVNTISRQLDAQNSSIRNNKFGVSESSLDKWILLEKQITFSFVDLLNYYVAAENLKEVQDTLHIRQFEALEAVYRDQVARIQGIRNALYKLNEQNTYLAIRNEIDNNLEVLDKILANLYEIKVTGDTSYDPAELDTLIVFNERKRTDTEMLLDYYDFDNSEYRTIMKECEASTRETNQLLKYIAQTKAEYQEKYPIYVSKREKNLIAKEINRLPMLIPEYNSLLQSHQMLLSAIKENIRFTDLHVAFIETNYYDRERKNQEQTLTFEQSQKLFNENQNRKLLVHNQLLSYVSERQNSPSELIEKINPNINIMASAYFALAELGNSLWQDKAEDNLSNYKKVLELDPGFYLTDAVLYNIGYLSGAIAKNRIDDGILEFESRYGISVLRPDSLKYTEANYNESIRAYRRLVDEYKESQYNSETLFRLGYHYFEIGTDADRPIEYYQVARNYYDAIITRQNDPYLYKALYQRGWTWLNSSSDDAYKNAIDDFIVILNAIDQKQIIDEVEVVDYSIASVKNIGYCLIGLDGYDNDAESIGAKYALNTLNGKLSYQNLQLVLDEAIDQKLRLYLPMQAIDFMNAKLELNPLALENPIVADSICTIYTQYPNQIRRRLSPEQAYLAEKEKIIARYSFNTDWYIANKDNDITRQLQIVRAAYVDVEKRYNNDFVDLPTAANFEKYMALINQYREFDAIHDENFTVWDELTQANVIAQNVRLAQLTKAPRHYLNLASRIYTYNDYFPQNKLFFNMEGTAYECARIVADSLKTDISVLLAREPDVNVPFREQNTLKYYQLAAERFIRVLNDERFRSKQNEDLLVSILMRHGEIAKDNKQYDLAESHYMMLVNHEGAVPKDVLRTAYINLGEIADATQNYHEAEQWYRRSEQYALDGKDREILHQYTLLQIQNSIDQAAEQQDHGKVAEDYIRLADEYTDKDPQTSLQYKGKAQEAYLEARDFDKSIALLLDMAKTKTQPKEVFDLYRLAWTIADSVGYVSKSDSLKQDFVNRYPASSEAYQLRLVFIDKKVSEPASIEVAGNMYLNLYQDVKQNKANPGDDDPSALIIAAIAMFDKAGDDNKKELLAEEFVSQYPDHPSTVTLLEYLADRQLTKGNKQRYEQLSRQIFLKDKTKQLRYANIAKEKLRDIALEFDKAYAETDWPLTIAKMNEFKKTHSDYEKEGLNLEFEPVYESFKVAESEYKVEQDKVAFVGKFNRQITTIENDFLKKSYGQLIRVNYLTSWKRHLVAGEKRIPALKNTTANEIKKIRQLLEEGAVYELNVEQRLKAFDLICRIADHSAKAINAQSEKYMNESIEFEAFRGQFRNALDELYSGFNAEKNSQVYSVLQLSYPYNLAMYKYFYLPGLKNRYTTQAVNRLSEINALPKYRIDHMLIDDSWKLSQNALGESSEPEAYKGGISTITRQDGKRYSRLNIPASSELIVQKNLEMDIPYDYIIANLVSPYYDETKIKLDYKNLEYTYNPIDTLNVGNTPSIRYALILGEGNFKAGSNDLEFRLINYDSKPLSVDLNLMAVTDSVKFETTEQIQTINFTTDDTWEYANYQSDMTTARWEFAARAYNARLTDAKLNELDFNPNQMIWAKVQDLQDTTAVVFQKSIMVNGDLQDGFIRFVAPDIAVVSINGKELVSTNKIHYDTESKLVYAGHIVLSPDVVKQGENTLQITIRNHSKWKGLMAEVMMVIAQRGDL